METINSRREQMFPKLTTAEIDRIRRFGRVQRYAKGALLFKTGEVSPGMFVLISGTVAVSWRDGESVIMRPGATALTRMPCGPHSMASMRVT